MPITVDQKNSLLLALSATQGGLADAIDTHQHWLDMNQGHPDTMKVGHQKAELVRQLEEAFRRYANIDQGQTLSIAPPSEPQLSAIRDEVEALRQLTLDANRASKVLDLGIAALALAANVRNATQGA